MQAAERRRVERAQLRLVDDMKTDERILRSVVELDVEREGFEQVVVAQGREKGGARAIAFVERAEPFGRGLEIGGRHPVFVEQPPALARSDEHTSELQSLM